MRIRRGPHVKFRIRHHGRPACTRWILVCVLGLLFVPPSVSAQTLEDLFRPQLPVTHYVVLLDTSGSMRPYFAGVAGSLRQFLSSLKSPDTVTVIRFDTTWVRLCTGTAGEIVVDACAPDRVEFGRHTDIGAALRQGLAEAERSTADILILLFLTDGKHEPPPFSQYPGLAGQAWTELERKGYRLAQQREIFGFAVGLRQYADVALLRRVLPPDRTQVINLSAPGLLQGQLDAIRAKIRQRRLASAVREELRKGRVAINPAGPPRIVGERLIAPYGVRSEYSRLPVRFRLRTIEGRPDARVSLPSGAATTLEPGKAVPLEVFLPVPTSAKWRVGKTVERWEEALTLVPEAAFVHEREIQALGITPAVRVAGTSQTLNVSRQAGIAVTFLGGLLAGVIMVAWGRRRWLSIPPPSAYGVLQLPASNQSYAIEVFRKPVVTLGGPEGDVALPGASEPRATIQARRQQGWDSLVVIPASIGAQVGDRWVVPGQEEALEQEVVHVQTGGVEVVLSEVGPRRAPSAQWGPMAVLLAGLAVGLVVLHRFGP